MAIGQMIALSIGCNSTKISGTNILIPQLVHARWLQKDNHQLAKNSQWRPMFQKICVTAPSWVL